MSSQQISAIDDWKLAGPDPSGAIPFGEADSASIATGNSFDPGNDWFQDCLGQTLEKVDLRIPEANGHNTTPVRFKIATQRLFCQLGEWVPARFPLRIARFSGEVPDEESAYNSIFSAVLNRDFDAICLGPVRTETLLWRYLQTSLLIRKSFRSHSQHGPQPHWLIRLDGSFTDYMKRFSAKTRKNRLREIKILRGLGELKLVRVTAASEIDAFLEAAYRISRQTRQFRQFGWSIAARDPRLLKNALLRGARNGWLRSYLLTCGNVPCSFILGQQSCARFHPVAAGVDPAWRDYGVGTVLLLLVLEDLFKQNSPDFYDLGATAAHKEYLATDSYLEEDIWLFRRRPYPALASSICTVCNLSSRFGGDVLQRLRLKEKVTQLMRRWTSSPSKPLRSHIPALNGTVVGAGPV
jgi:Acetyltransferase (GNAT) domain